jgi:hypothetical protein
MKKFLALMMFAICTICGILLSMEIVPPLSRGIQGLFVILLGISLSINLILIDETF